MAIHKTAIIDPSATIDPSTEVGANVVIEENVKIGPNNKIWPNAYICKNTTLDEGNKVHMGVVLGHEPQDIAFKDEPSFTQIGNFNVFREYSQIHRGTVPGSSTVIGDYCFFMAVSHVGHNCQIGNHVIIVNNTLLAGYVEIGDFVFISGNCMVHQNTRIGALAMMSGGSGVSKDIPPFMLVDGINVVAAINSVGLRRGGFSPQIRKAIKQAYEILYRSDLKVSSALDEIEKTIPGPEVEQLVQFIRESKRGICRHRRIGESGARSIPLVTETAKVDS